MSTGKTNHHVVFLGVGWGIYGLALLLSCARVYGRFVTTRHPAAGDYLILLTMVSTPCFLWIGKMLTFRSVYKHCYDGRGHLW